MSRRHSCGRCDTGRDLCEAQLQRLVVELARWTGWRVHAERPAATPSGWRTPIQGDAGFPDLVLARSGEMIFAELKSRTGRLAEEQKAWGLVLGTVPGVAYYVWRPADWFAGRIEEVLRAL